MTEDNMLVKEIALTLSLQQTSPIITVALSRICILMVGRICVPQTLKRRRKE